MPAILAHHLFGTEAFAACSDCFCPNDDKQVRDAFLLGNNAPDALFCLKALPFSVECKRLGATVHSEKPAEFFKALHWHFIANPPSQNPLLTGHRTIVQSEVLRAFALGFLCHYLLDSTVHPLVYAQQFAFCDSGLEGLSREKDGGDIHALIETDLDEYLLAEKLGMSVADYPPHRMTMQLGLAALHDVSAAFSKAVADCYEFEISDNTLTLGVMSYRTGQRMLDSKRDGLRRHFDYGRLAGSSYRRVQALTHSCQLRTTTPFANNDHVAWQHPFNPDDRVSESFDELYERALATASIAIPLFVQPELTIQEGGPLSFTTNYYGKPVATDC